MPRPSPSGRSFPSSLNEDCRTHYGYDHKIMASSVQPGGVFREPGRRDTVMSTSAPGPDMLDIHVMSVALIGPEEQRRRAVASVLAGSQANLTREFSAYPVLDAVTQLLDLDLPLGAAALDLGIITQFSTANALQDTSRLDSNFLSKLLTKHSSGLSVLSAPDNYTSIHATDEGIAKLLTVARQDFDYVVVDAGSTMGSNYKALLEGANVAYLVTQVSIPELRNSNRLISEFFTLPTPKLEIVLNRFTTNTLGIDEENIKKALTMSPKWKIPNDYVTVQRAQNTATPLALGDSAIAGVIRQMARMACGMPAFPEKKRRFHLFG